MSLNKEVIQLAVEIIASNNQGEVSQELRKIADESANLRKKNVALEKAMATLEVQKKKNSKEYKELKREYNENTDRLKVLTEQNKKYSATLDKSAMSADQLKARADQLRKTLNSMVKEADPEGWSRYNKELKETVEQLKKTRAGADETGAVWKSMLKGFSITAFAGVVVGGAKKMFNGLVGASQGWGDKWEEVVAGMKAGTEGFFRTIATGDWSNLFSNIKEAVRLGMEYQRVLDDLADRRRSYSLAEAEAALEMEKQERIFKNANLPITERIAAVDKYNAEVKKLGDTRRSMIDQELNDDEGGFKKMVENATKLDAVKVDNFIREYDNQKKLREEAKKYIEDLKEASKANLVIATSFGTRTEAANSPEKKAAKERIAVANDSVREYAEILHGIDATNDEMLDKYVQLQKDLMMVDVQILQDTQRSAQRKNNLEKEAANERAKAQQAAIDKEHAQVKLVLTKRRSEEQISAEQYEQQLYDLEVTYLQKRIAAEKESSAERVKLEQQLVELDMKTLVKREQENAKILAEREKHFAALQKITDDYTKSQADKDTAEVLAIQQKYQQAFDAEVAALNKGLVSKEAYLLREGELRSMMEGEIAAKVAEQRKNAAEREKKEAEKFTKERTDALKRYDVMSLAELEQEEQHQLKEAYDKKLLTEEEFQTAKENIRKKYAEAAEKSSEQELDDWLAGAREKLAGAQAAISVAGNLISAMQDSKNAETDLKREEQLAAEYATYEAKLAAVKGNEEAEAKVKQEYEDKKATIEYNAAKEKLDTEKKFADANFAIQVAQAVAGGAAAVIQCFAQLGPIAGAIAAVAVGVTTGLQIATLNKERQKIKATTLEAPSSSTSSSSGNASTSTPSPSRQAIPEDLSGSTIVPVRAKGKYDVISEEDGREYRDVPLVKDATGVVTRPTLVAEEPELVVSVRDFPYLQKHINYPLVVEAINDAREGRSVPARAQGNYESIENSRQSAVSNRQRAAGNKQYDSDMAATLSEMRELLMHLKKNGVAATTFYVATEAEKQQKRMENARTKAQK